MHKSVNHPLRLATISHLQHSYGPFPPINPFSYSLFLKSVPSLSHETSVYLEEQVPQAKNQSGQISMRVTIQYMEEKQSKYGSGRGSFGDEIRLEDGDEQMLSQIFRNSSSKLDRNQFKLKLSRLQNSQAAQSQSVQQIVKKAYFLYFLSFATNIVLPLNKAVRLIVEQSLNKTGITVQWRKGYDYYIGYLGRTVKPMLCCTDIGYLFQQTIWHQEINEIESFFSFMADLSLSKKRNAYLYCEDTFRTQLLPQLLQMEQEEVFPQYQTLLNFIETAYQSLSCRKILDKFESEEQRRKSKSKSNQVSNMSTHRTYVNSLRTTKKIAHSLESSLSNSREEQSNYSLKKLKQEMKNLLLNGIDQNKSRISKLTNQDGQGKVLIDSEVKEFVCENIRSLFESEYQNIKQSHKNWGKAEKCKVLVSSMSQFLKIDYKCQYFIELIIEQFLASKKDKTIVDLQKSFINLVQKNKKVELKDEKWEMHDCKQDEKIIISRIVTKQNEESRIQLNFNDLQNDNDEMLLSQNEEIDANLTKPDLQKKANGIENLPNFSKAKENESRKSSLPQQKLMASKSIGNTQPKPIMSTRQKVKTQNSVRSQPKQSNDKYLSNKIEEIKKQSSLQQSQRDKNKQNATFGSRPRTKTETSDTKPQIKNQPFPKQPMTTLSKPSTPKSSLNSTLSSANLNKLSMKTNTAATPKVSANKLESTSKMGTPKNRGISNSSSTKKLWQ